MIKICICNGKLNYYLSICLLINKFVLCLVQVLWQWLCAPKVCALNKKFANNKRLCISRLVWDEVVCLAQHTDTAVSCSFTHIHHVMWVCSYKSVSQVQLNDDWIGKHWCIDAMMENFECQELLLAWIDVKICIYIHCKEYWVGKGGIWKCVAS